MQPQKGKDQTHIGTLADRKLKNSRISPRPLLSGQATHVLYRSFNSYKETSLPRSAPNKCNPMTPVKPLENLRKGDPNLKISPPGLKLMAPRGQCPSKPATKPTQPCSSEVYRCLKRRLGCSLRRHHSNRDLVPAQSKLDINYLELKAVLLARKSSKTYVKTRLYS